jgi:hypothetical protein
MEARVSHELMYAHAKLKKARADMAHATRVTDIAKDEKEIANRTRESEYHTRICVEAERDGSGKEVLDLREESEGLKRSTTELNQEAVRRDLEIEGVKQKLPFRWEHFAQALEPHGSPCAEARTGQRIVC